MLNSFLLVNPQRCLELVVNFFTSNNSLIEQHADSRCSRVLPYSKYQAQLVNAPRCELLNGYFDAPAPYHHFTVDVKDDQIVNVASLFDTVKAGFILVGTGYLMYKAHELMHKREREKVTHEASETVEKKFR